MHGGGIRNNSLIPAGDVTALNTYEIAPFSNFVTVVPEVPRDTLRQLLERGVAASPSAAGASMQVAGMKFTYDTTQQAQVVEPGGNTIITPGQRVQSIVLDDGTVIVENGAVVDGPAVSLASNDFSARGGDGYPFGGAAFTPVGITYQAALQQYLSDALSGTVTAAQYPEGGSPHHADRLVRRRASEPASMSLALQRTRQLDRLRELDELLDGHVALCRDPDQGPVDNDQNARTAGDFTCIGDDGSVRIWQIGFWRPHQCGSPEYGLDAAASFACQRSPLLVDVDGVPAVLVRDLDIVVQQNRSAATTGPGVGQSRIGRRPNPDVGLQVSDRPGMLGHGTRFSRFDSESQAFFLRNVHTLASRLSVL